MATTVVVALATAVAGAGCAGPADCGYNGQCVAVRPPHPDRDPPDGAPNAASTAATHHCVCTQPWKGPECQVLDLAPVRGPAYGLREPSTSSWGGSVLQADDGRWYMWAAQMVDHCGIDAWTRNSRVVLAAADNLSAPFTVVRQIAGVFSHEPAATRGPNGEFVLYYTTTALGCGEYGPCVPPKLCGDQPDPTRCNPGGATCTTQCTGGITAPGCYDNGTEASPEVRFPTYMTYAMHPLGPYSEPVMVYSGADQPGNAAPATGDTNLAAVIFGDGSLAGMWRGDRKVAGHRGPVYQYQYAVHASDWKEPSTYRWGEALKPFNIFPQLVGPADTMNCGVEDPMLWVDRAGIVHAVMHNWRAGAHAASADRGKTWRWYGGRCSSSAGPSSLDWTRSVWAVNVSLDGEVVAPHRRERPHVVLGADGTIRGITTSFEITGPAPGSANDLTFTLLQTTAAH